METLIAATVAKLTGDTKQPRKKSTRRVPLQRVTGLLDAVNQQCVEAIVQCFGNSQPADVSDDAGNNALHLAVATKNLDVIRAILLLFERTHGLSKKKNKNGFKPIDLTNITEIRKCFDVFEPASRPPAKELGLKTEIEKARNTQCIKAVLESLEGESSVLLAFDGGGVRGIVLIMILMALERRLAGPIRDYVTWIAGTSTGAIMALALGTNRSLDESLRLYLRIKSEVFGQLRPYNARQYEGILKDIFGANTRLSDIKEHKVVITTCRCNEAPPKLKLYRNYVPAIESKSCKDLEYDSPDSVYCWKACRASSAAPTYFSAFEGIFCDGGIMANNPTTELMIEYFRYRDIQEHVGGETPPPLGVVISMGTGMAPTIPIVSKPQPKAFFKMLSNTTEHIKNMTMVFVKQLTASDGLPVERAQSWCHGMEVPFFRFSPPLSNKIDLDEHRDLLIVRMMWEVELYLVTEAATDIDQLVVLLEALKALKTQHPSDSAKETLETAETSSRSST